MLTRRAFTAGASVLAIGCAGRAWAAEPIKIGVLTDMSGVLSAVLGTGSVDGARMAIEDFGGAAAGLPVELVFADHQNKPDIASAIARRWIDEEKVDLVMDLGQSACAIACQTIVQAKDKVIIVTGAASSDITGQYCNRNSFHWGYDTYMESAALAGELTRSGNDTWFFLTADYAYGHALENDARKKIEAEGGKIIGGVRHPANTRDFSSFLLQAQSSRAKMIGVANSGDDLERTMRQGSEFGLWTAQKAACFGLQLYNVQSIGVDAMQGVLHNSVFYWDRNDDTRAFAQRFWKRNGKPPAETHAVNYSAVTQYLKAIKAAGSKDTDAVLKALHDLPVSDPITPTGAVRKDGRLIRPTYLARVKRPGEVKDKWDCLEIVAEIPGEQAYKPVSESACSLLKA